MVVSTLSFACMNGIVKHLVHMNAFQIVFFRSFSCLFFTFGYLLKNNIPILGNKKGLLIVRGLVGVTSMTLFFMSTKYLPIGTAVSLRYMGPIFAAIFAVILLKEAIRPIQWLFFIIAFSGVIVLKGFDASLSIYGLSLVFVSAVFVGLVYVIINKIGKSDHPVVVVNYFMVISTIVGGLLALNYWVTPKGWEWLMVFGLGFFGYFGQVYMTKAFQIVKTTKIAPFKYLEVVFTLLLGVALFSEIYSFWSLLGIALIITGLVLNVTYKSKLKE
ncbi:EamA-like transporter family protein [Hyunsoonleella jejuensis]|uniref:EamA-like transporter family protein n=2 Tax=Hyunsoonleella jejuensis TaxID=419940 RepID=A0A1H9FR06_9FLAO|nr:EamA-like transporter family protein [Hyunsoonleella jejuensis]